jgi:hypothetical protein
MTLEMVGVQEVRGWCTKILNGWCTQCKIGSKITK